MYFSTLYILNTHEKFKIFHPGGNIGNSLLLARDIMVTGSKMPIIDHKKNFKEALKIMSQKKLGIVVITKKKFILENAQKYFFYQLIKNLLIIQLLKSIPFFNSKELKD